MKKVETIMSNKEVSMSMRFVEVYLNDESLCISDVYNKTKEYYEKEKGKKLNRVFVNNVIHNYCRKNNMEVRINENRGDRKIAIIEAINKGLTNVAIAKELKCDYNYVWKIRKELKK